MIEITGLEERIKQMGELSTKNPLMRKRINEVIRQTLAKVRKTLQGEAQTGLQMGSDPRKAYKAVRMAVYRRLFGGQVNILQSRKAHGGRLYEPPRRGTSDPKGRGGNRALRSARTEQLMSYQGADRGFILRFLNGFNSIKGTIKTRVPRHTGVNDYWHHCTCKVTKKRTKKCRCGKIKVSWEIDNPA